MALYPTALKKLIPPGPTDPRIKARVVILHVAVSEQPSLYGYFNGPSNGVESHFYIRRDGTTEQYRDTDWQADANTDANGFAISIETQGMERGEWTPQQLDAIKALILWCHDVHDIPLQRCPAWDGSGVGYHTLFPGRWDKRGASCPGPDRKLQFNQIITPWLTAPAPVEDDMPYTEQELRDAAGAGVLGAKVGRTGLTVGVILDRLYASAQLATARDVAQTAAITALAQSNGADPEVIKAAVADALNTYTLTLTKES